jgi:hypothetical protein
VEIVRQLFDAYRSQAIDAAVEIAHPDIEVRPSIVGGPESKPKRCMPRAGERSSSCCAKIDVRLITSDGTGASVRRRTRDDG